MLNKIIAKTYAVEVGVEIPGTSQTNFKYSEYISAFINWAIKIGFGLAIVMILYAGIKYIISQGNTTTINDAKEIALGAILGFIVLLLIQYILKALDIPAT